MVFEKNKSVRGIRTIDPVSNPHSTTIKATEKNKQTLSPPSPNLKKDIKTFLILILQTEGCALKCLKSFAVSPDRSH